MAQRVGDELPHDADRRVRDGVVHPLAPDVEAHLQLRAAGDRRDGARDRLAEVRLVERVAAQVEEAALQLGPAGLEHPLGGVEGPADLRRGARGEALRGGQLEREPAEALRERIVQLHREARPLAEAHRGPFAPELRAQQLAAAARGEALEGAVPDEDGGEDGEQQQRGGGEVRKNYKNIVRAMKNWRFN